MGVCRKPAELACSVTVPLCWTTGNRYEDWCGGREGDGWLSATFRTFFARSGGRALRRYFLEQTVLDDGNLGEQRLNGRERRAEWPLPERRAGGIRSVTGYATRVAEPEGSTRVGAQPSRPGRNHPGRITVEPEQKAHRNIDRTAQQKRPQPVTVKNVSKFYFITIRHWKSTRPK